MISTLRRELFDRTLIHGERHPRQVLTEPINLADYRLRRKPILGGLTSEYQIAA